MERGKARKRNSMKIYEKRKYKTKYERKKKEKKKVIYAFCFLIIFSLSSLSSAASLNTTQQLKTKNIINMSKKKVLPSTHQRHS